MALPSRSLGGLGRLRWQREEVCFSGLGLSLGAAPPWPAGLSPAPGTARPLLGVKGSVGTTLAWLLSPALMLICPCFGLLCFKKHGSISPAGRPPPGPSSGLGLRGLPVAVTKGIDQGEISGQHCVVVKGMMAAYLNLGSAF